MPWRGWKKDYSIENKNFFPAVSLDKSINLIENVAKSDEFKHVSTIVVDGLNNIMSIEDTAAYFGKRPQYKGKYDVYEAISQKTIWLIEIAKSYRADLNVIFTAHVKTADPYSTGEVDRLFTPGKALISSTFSTPRLTMTAITFSRPARLILPLAVPKGASRPLFPTIFSTF